MLPVLVYHDYLAEVSGNPSMAATASLVMLALSTLLLMLQRLFLARRSYPVASARRADAACRSRKDPRRWPRWPTAHRASASCSCRTWVSCSLVRDLEVRRARAARSRSRTTARCCGGPRRRSSVSYALALVVDRRRRRARRRARVRRGAPIVPLLSPALGALVMAPFLIPGTVLAVGLIVAFNRPPLLLTGTPLILVLAYVIRKLPYALKAAEAGLYQVHPSLEEAALVGRRGRRRARSATSRRGSSCPASSPAARSRS